ncbi:hypothetical protein EpBp4_0002 [Escherichia phage Bp4]|uniref:Uncharacterized protein n=2 Tax=Gamaleyavirus Bp4 TaxID=1920757 RepID=X2KS45_9CAUD|nr:hypothetical protein EpBp4_0002 [Escherichia phage Bp4]AHN83346.2 hypothetical protein EpBp4_0002 [Escherichia phage Bp4]AXY81365.1 hypothetical protein [Escherichia phage PD38]
MKLNTSPYPVQLEVVLDRDTFIKKYKKLKGYEPDLEGCKGYTTYSGNRVLIGIFKEPLHTLIHELNHFCLWVFDYIGMPINSTNSEAYCYYYDYILSQIPSSYLTAYK